MQTQDTCPGHAVSRQCPKQDTAWDTYSVPPLGLPDFQELVSVRQKLQHTHWTFPVGARSTGKPTRAVKRSNGRATGGQGCVGDTA